MSDYSTLKVPELKKLLAEKKLPQTGNKADLIARLQEDDKKNASPSAAGEEDKEEDKPAETKEDEITYSDDELASKPKAAETSPEKPADEAAPEESAEAAEKPAEEASSEKPEEAKDADEPEAGPSFALGLSSTAAEDEIKKRADRAKRFGLEVDDETQKLTDRAKRFGIDDKELATGLDSALPERPLKRGRGRNEGEGNRPGKRQSRDRRGGAGTGGGGERRSARNKGKEVNAGGAASSKTLTSVMDDPSEKAKAEKRAARFAAA
ncbi:hypothetical protein PT974_04321 [Cladobotryum mycophilum]|uniref:SAP domain-containing protein n=1 Tax=Cladobotryum mycophilum TaxID=491253 RepID=A0ABR0SUS0_9HYPO